MLSAMSFKGMRTTQLRLVLGSLLCASSWLWISFTNAGAAEPFLAAELVFPLHPQHNHPPAIVECENGDLLVSWYRGSGERSADSAVMVARTTLIGLREP